MDYTLCLNASTIKPTPLLDKIRLAGEHGYAGIELWLNDVYDHVSRGGEARDVEKALSDHGLIVPCVIALRAWGEAIDEEYHLYVDECRRRMALAARLGAPYVVATPPRRPCDIAQITRRYGDLLAIGREEGVKPVMEYISFFQSVRTLDQAWQIVQDAGDDDATLILDAFHTWNSPSTPDLLASIPVQRIAHYHIDDGAPDKPRLQQTDPDRVMPGDGLIDLAGEIATLRQMGYFTDANPGTVSLELFSQDWWSRDPGETLRVGRERLEQLFAK